ncbi:DUF1924 domain-containing protein [Thiocapsa bogorovii]|nr:DUF1924 domain-containing protein [Thiocapsa bogorovii]UHD18502.1 DUF1924 domain-containing protein [Thiocapsa bogorovii]
MKQRFAIALVATGALTLPTALLAADPAAGQAGWTKEYTQTDGSPARSCATCHGRDLTRGAVTPRPARRSNPWRPQPIHNA